MLEDNYFPKIDLFDIVGGQTFPAPDSNSQKDGLFFRLTAYKAQWFIF